MKRKVIQLAGKTLVVSLPSKWAREYGITKGDEVEVEEREREILVKTESSKAIERKKIDLKVLDKMARRMVGASYKFGFDEVDFRFEDPKTLGIIQKEVEGFLIGFEIIEQGRTFCKVKEVSSLNKLEFENMLRLIFRTLIQISEDFFQAAKNNDLDQFTNISLRDRIINRYSDFCRRTLNKFGYSTLNKTPIIYHIVEELEKIGDGYKDLCKIIVNEKIKLSKTELKILKRVNNLLVMINDLFYNYNDSKIETFGEQCLSLKKEVKEGIVQIKRENLAIFLIVYNLVTQFYDLNGVLLMKSL